MQPISAWLSDHGLHRYAESFIAADIDLEILPSLSDDELATLGVTLGDRKRIARALVEAAPAPAGTAGATDSEESGERRQLSIVFCDLVDSTKLATQLDPEELRTTIKGYHAACSEVVARHGGEVAQFLGDGVMVQFGFPRAHEDDAERAARCALDLIIAVRDLRTPAGLRLRTRAGIATGTEVVGDLADATRDRMSVVGTTPSLASRLQAIADPEAVVITTATRQLLADAFVLTQLPNRPIKGIGDDVPLWRIDGERRGASRFTLHRTATAAPFVGREHEMAFLRDRWRLAAEGEGRAVVLLAEAGLGKSRIVEEFLSAIDGERIVIRLQCAPHFSATALQPLRDFVERSARIEAGDGTPVRYEKIRALADRSGETGEAAVAALALLLGLENAEDAPLVRDLTDEQRKAFVSLGFLQAVERLARARPVCLVIEDVHWIDPSTLDVLTQLVEAASEYRILFIATARPEFVSPWSGLGHMSMLSVNRLERRAVETIVSDIARDAGLDHKLFAQIVSRTDGVPLFVEELTRSVVESASSGQPVTSIPGTLRDALTARLDALEADRDVAQFGSIVGREFSAELLAAIGERSLESLRPALDRLLASGLVHRQGMTGTKFAFKHALVRDVAYETLLRPRRRQLHLRAAHALAARAGETTECVPEIVAHHFEEASKFEEALGFWRQAVSSAIDRSAFREAAAHVRRALGLLDRIDPGDGSTELDLRNSAGVVFCVLEGGRSQAARESYERGLSLSGTLAESEATFTALWGACFCDYMSGRTPLALERSRALIALAERLGNPDLLLEALHAVWAANASVGNVDETLDATARGIEIYDPQRHHVHVTRFGTGHDSGVCGAGFRAQALILSGRIAAGRDAMARTRDLVERLNHPYTTCVGLQHIACAHAMLGEHAEAQRIAAQDLAIAEPANFPMPRAFGNVIEGAALVGLGRTPEGMARLATILDDPTNAVPANWRPLHAASLALAEHASGHSGPARERLERALSYAVDIHGCIAEPELYLALARIAETDPAAALEHLATASARARQAGTTLLELRAAAARVRVLGSIEAGANSAVADLARLLAQFAPEDDCPYVREARETLRAASPIAR